MSEAICEVCGNTYDRPISVKLDGKAHDFDCFECAIHALAPLCGHCGCRVIGHGVQDDGAIYCCVHCAQASGVQELHDRT